MIKDQTGIDIKIFKKYITKNYGKKCPERAMGCMTCEVWRIYEDLENFIKLDKELKKDVV